MNYFEFYDLPVSFILDEKALKKQYLRMSKKFHPDFHTLASTEDKEHMLDMSAYNNMAFRTLSDPEKRIAYILQLKGVLSEEVKSEVPQDFLIEMMDINERLMDLQMESDNDELKKNLLTDLTAIETTIQSDLSRAMELYDLGEQKEDCLQQVKNNYLKSKYVSRIRAQLG